MFKFWKYLFNNKINSIPEPNVIVKEEQDNKQKYLCSINFELNYDGTHNILCYWPDLDNLDEKLITNIANQYGILICLLNNGLLQKDIADTLTSVLKEDNISDTFFVQKVLYKWLELADQDPNKRSSEPVMKPSSVFKHYSK